ncbi:unnamed protein product [Schistosoma margrebowiei]|uniref:URB1 N-terminal domain-containing protein n=1 Tax=Schistosoma margrebowiei TaxID=48269 RepID=A0A183N4D3_9TREM|nr:unnamed protein product [Schistosoma margrebowiei]
MPERSKRIKLDDVLLNFVESLTNEDVDESVVDVIAGGDVVRILKFLDSGQDRKTGEIAENSSVSKTQRVRVFNRHCLQRLTSLYLWRGEGKTVDEVLRKDNAEIYRSISKYIVQFTITALTHSLTIEVLAINIANFCVLSPKMIDPIRKALQYDKSSDVKNKAIELMGYLQQLLEIPLTWLSLNQLPSTMNFTSDQLKMKIELFIREVSSESDNK